MNRVQIKIDRAVEMVFAVHRTSHSVFRDSLDSGSSGNRGVQSGVVFVKEYVCGVGGERRCNTKR